MIDLPKSNEDRNWEKLGAYLSSDDVRLLSDEERSQIRADYEDIGRQELLIDDAILIGLVGGTGVGKSTFINALAGEEVSRSGDRRPTTDRVVVYRHVDTELPDDVPTTDFSQPLVLHNNDDLVKVVLFDFPDFDSAERKHTHILQKYLEYLDVLLIVVDDVKYADRRLYTLLASLDHDPGNLFVLLNKTDRLEGRYGDDTERVITELLADLRDKMQANANLDLRPDQLYPISAATILKLRQGEDPSVAGDRARNESRFQKVETLLGGYRADKYRRQVRERNIDARKQQLTEQLQRTALSDENRSILNETKSMLNTWQGDLKKSLAAIPRELLSEGERAALRRARLRRAGPRWGMPFSLVFSALIEMPWARKAVDALEPSELGGRVHQHYRGFFEATRNLVSRFQSEFAGSHIAAENQITATNADGVLTTSPEQWSAEMATEVQVEIQDDDSHIPRTKKWLCHLPALVTVGLAIWTKVYPFLAAATGTGDRGFFESIATGLMGALNPMFLIGVFIAVLAAYIFTGLYLWMREVQALDVKIATAERAIREDVREKGQQVLTGLEANVQRLTHEFATVEDLLPL